MVASPVYLSHPRPAATSKTNSCLLAIETKVGGVQIDAVAVSVTGRDIAVVDLGNVPAHDTDRDSGQRPHLAQDPDAGAVPRPSAMSPILRAPDSTVRLSI